LSKLGFMPKWGNPNLCSHGGWVTKVHQVGFIVLTWGGEIIEYWKKSFKLKQKTIVEFGCTFGIFGQPLVNRI
jgi:hypothetical protein